MSKFFLSLLAVLLCLQCHSTPCLAAPDVATDSTLQAIREAAMLKSVEARREFREMGSEVAREYAALMQEIQTPYRGVRETRSFRLLVLLTTVEALMRNEEELNVVRIMKKNQETSLNNWTDVFGYVPALAGASAALVTMNTSAAPFGIISLGIGSSCLMASAIVQDKRLNKIREKFDEENKVPLAVRYYMSDFWQGYAETSREDVPCLQDGSQSYAELVKIRSRVLELQQKFAEPEPQIAAPQLRVGTADQSELAGIADDPREDCEEGLDPGVATQSQRRGA